MTRVRSHSNRMPFSVKPTQPGEPGPAVSGRYPYWMEEKEGEGEEGDDGDEDGGGGYKSLTCDSRFGPLSTAFFMATRRH